MRAIAALLPLLPAMFASASALAARVPLPLTAQTEVFTNAGIMLTGTEGARIYYVDGLAQLKAQLSADLPADPKQAAEIVKRRARAMGAALQTRAINASEGITRATYYGVNRVPAVVFDGHAVVFGVTDIAKARVLYEQSRLQPTPSGTRRAP
jgi:integrating conjugative element protein (TIGR03757 family)